MIKIRIAINIVVPDEKLAKLGLAHLKNPSNTDARLEAAFQLIEKEDSRCNASFLIRGH